MKRQIAVTVDPTARFTTATYISIKRLNELLGAGWLVARRDQSDGRLIVYILETTDDNAPADLTPEI